MEKDRSKTQRRAAKKKKRRYPMSGRGTFTIIKLLQKRVERTP